MSVDFVAVIVVDMVTVDCVLERHVYSQSVINVRYEQDSLKYILASNIVLCLQSSSQNKIALFF